MNVLVAFLGYKSERDCQRQMFEVYANYDFSGGGGGVCWSMFGGGVHTPCNPPRKSTPASKITVLTTPKYQMKHDYCFNIWLLCRAVAMGGAGMQGGVTPHPKKYS